jgi:sulfite reductase (NADPH) flavoprotein alpha-component
MLTIMARLTGLDESALAARDITRLTPLILEFCAARAPAMAAVLHAQDETVRQDWLWGRQLGDLLAEYTVTATAEDWRAVLRPLAPRLYSISSSLAANPEEVHLTVNIVRYGSAGRESGGVCSRFLADRAEAANVFIQPSAHFHLPADDATPVIMIGPGTGVAPFRAFLQERRARGAAGRNWLVFGEQHAGCDFYYRDELERFAREGYLHRLSTAFSRDQKSKIYVQDRLREDGPNIWAWLQEGAHVYVCGDAVRMAKDVDAALRDVMRTVGGVDADAYVDAMTAQKRYLRDVY